MENLKYYIKSLAKLSPIASKSVKKCELVNFKHRIVSFKASKSLEHITQSLKLFNTNLSRHFIYLFKLIPIIAIYMLTMIFFIPKYIVRYTFRKCLATECIFLPM